MKTKASNKYYNRSHISEGKFRQLINCFSLDLNAYETSKITNLSHVSCKKIYQKLRIHIFNHLLDEELSYREIFNEYITVFGF
jgi:Trp operon repressor